MSNFVSIESQGYGKIYQAVMRDNTLPLQVVEQVLGRGAVYGAGDVLVPAELFPISSRTPIM